MQNLTPTLHRDGTISYWSIYRQQWVEHSHCCPDEELAAMSSAQRERIVRHLDRAARIDRLFEGATYP